MSDLRVYEDEVYSDSNPPNYVFDNLKFICTCGACPEQYDVVLTKDGKRYQVGYVRLRFGNLRVECPDYGGKEVYYQGFDDEDERLVYLQKAADAIQGWLKGD